MCRFFGPPCIVDYMTETSIMHCRHVVTFLLHAATDVYLSVISSEENGVGEDAINTQQSRVFCVHVTTLVWSETVSCYNTPDSVVKHRRRK